MSETATKFTPGPWPTEPRDDGKCIYVGEYDGMQAICEVDTDDVDVDVAEANARLISAAPDLYAACKDMLEKISRLYPNDWQGTRGQATAALAKAEGK